MNMTHTLKSELTYAGRTYPEGWPVEKGTEPASGGYMFVKTELVGRTFILSVTEDMLMPITSK